MITGDSGDNTLMATAASDDIHGLDGNDTIAGADRNDTLSGGNDDDTFVGALTYQSTIDGGSGIDTLDLSDSTTDYRFPGMWVIDIDQGVSINNGVSFTDGAYSNLENIISFQFISIEMIGNAADNTLISSVYDDILRGEDGNDVLDGRAGDDTLFGDAGDDTLFGGDGLDRLYGGSGNDTLKVTDATSLDHLNGGNGDDIADLSAITGYDMVFDATSQKYRLASGGDSFDFYAIEVIHAGAGNDLFVGSDAYRLTIDGGVGVDTLDISSSYINLSQLGKYVLDIDQGFSVDRGETFIYGDFSNLENVISFDRVAIELIGNSADNALTGSIYGDLFHGEAGDDTIIARDGDDQIFGGDGRDTLSGDEGDDEISGGRGIDRIFGGEGADVLTGEQKGDRIEGGNGDDHLSGNAGRDRLFGQDGNDTLDGGGGKDVLRGGSGHDTLDGGRDDDELVGNSGNDTFINSAGSDTNEGGSGKDVFVFNDKTLMDDTGDVDVILDFEVGRDKIDLSGMDADAALAGDQAFTFVAAGGFTNQAGQVAASTSGGHTFLDFDFDGDGVSDATVQLSDFTASLAESDFIL